MNKMDFLSLAQTKLKNLIFLVAILPLILVGCKDDPTPTPTEPGINSLDTLTNFTGLVVPKTGSITFSMDYQFAGVPIIFESKNYVNAAKDTFTINALKHYLSNITLTKSNGSKLNLGTYHLLNPQAPGSTIFTIDNVPAGHYTGMQIALGIDSTRNYGGLQEGALDPSWGMFWTWNTGYIFFRINGNASAGKSFSYDLGGSEHLVRVNMDLTTYKVKSVNPRLGMLMDVNELFQNPENISFEKDGYTIHSNSDGPIVKVSANMLDMVSVKFLEN
ncbi:MAG: MbnP family protein [bacterium]|nr:MbnP family protein [bacterium]